MDKGTKNKLIHYWPKPTVSSSCTTFNYLTTGICFVLQVKERFSLGDQGLVENLDKDI